MTSAHTASTIENQPGAAPHIALIMKNGTEQHVLVSMDTTELMESAMSVRKIVPGTVRSVLVLKDSSTLTASARNVHQIDHGIQPPVAASYHL